MLGSTPLGIILYEDAHRLHKYSIDSVVTQREMQA
jgi:hypothetical protein